MENSEELIENLKVICSYNLLSLFFVFSILFVYGIGKDYLLFGIYEISIMFETMSMTPSWVSGAIATLSNTADILPLYLDLFWLLLTLTLFAELIVASYFAEREGWFSTLGFLTFGILIFLFMTGIFSLVGDWFTNNFINTLFSNIAYSTPFLNFYLNNLFIINTSLCVICIVANYIDLDFSGFSGRKDRETIQEVN
jgi:uncharacterized membrane protein